MGFLPLFFPLVLFFFSSLLEESCSLLFFFRLASAEVRNQFCVHGVTGGLVTILGLGTGTHNPRLACPRLDRPTPRWHPLPEDKLASAEKLQPARGCWGPKRVTGSSPSDPHQSVADAAGSCCAPLLADMDGWSGAAPGWAPGSRDQPGPAPAVSLPLSEP